MADGSAANDAVTVQQLQNGTTSGDTGNFARGKGSAAYGPNSTTIGINSVAGAINSNSSTAVGYNAQALGSDGTALGRDTSIASTISNSVALGYRSSATENYTVSVGNSNTKRRIVNMANGTANNDATTVSQLNSAISVSGGTVTLKKAAGSSKATVYTSAEVDKKIKAQDTAALKTRLDTVQQSLKMTPPTPPLYAAALAQPPCY